MCKTGPSRELISSIGEMIPHMSIREIAEQLNVSQSTVKRVIKKNAFMRTSEEKERVRSRSRTNLIKAERRRAIFGLEQRTCIKVFSNRERQSLKYRLKRKRYKFLKRADTTAYFDEETERMASYEERGRKLGLKFKPLELQTI